MKKNMKKNMKKKKNMKSKIKLNKYAIRRLFAIILIIFVVIFINGIISKNKKNKRPELSIIFNNEFITTKKEVIVDKYKNIYFSKDDIQDIFDEMIYYNDAEKELITTYNKHVALLKIGEPSMLVNDKNINLSGKLQEIKNVIYLPIKDLQIVYDIDVQYVYDNNRIIIDSRLEEKKQATVLNDTNLKNKKGLFKKNIKELNEGDTVTIISDEKNYKKIRTFSGEIGYVKDNQISEEKIIRKKNVKEIKELKIYKEYSNISGIYENIDVENDKLNVVSPTFFYLGKNSKILDKTTSSTATYANYTNWLKENEISILPTIENSESISSTLLTYSQRSKAINELCNKIIYYQYKGININFENIDDINSFYRFIIELAPRFKESGLIVCVTINDNVNKEKISKIADYVIEK